MRTCVDLLSPPHQSRQGRLLDYIGAAVLDAGAIALLSFAQNSYVIGGRVFSNPALVITTVDEDYINGENGAIATGRYVADFLPGIYDLVQIDPFGGEVIQNVVVSRGHEIAARAQAFYLQIILAFPSGQLTTEELEALIVPLNVKADWAEADADAASFIQNKPAFITEDDLNTLLSTSIGQQIEDQVEAQLVPVIASAEQAATDAQNALDALGDVRSYHTLGATYPIGAVVWSNVNDLSYRSITAHDDVQLDPANDPANWERVAAGWRLVSSAYTASPGDKVAADVSASAWTLTLPATPSAGDAVTVAVIDGDVTANNLTIDGGAANVQGAGTLILDVALATVRLIYNGTEWRVA